MKFKKWHIINPVYLLSAILLITTTSFIFFKTIDKVSLAVEAKTLYEGKAMVAKGTVYYKPAGGLLVTHFTLPYENVTITNANGEFKMYENKKNEVTQASGMEYSSKSSVFYSFLSGSSKDMGLSALGYKLSETRMQEKMIVTTWLPPVELQHAIGHIELVHEGHKTIYMGFYDKKNKPSQKIYYSNYSLISGLYFPLSITEFQYLETGDSIISKRTYSNLKINEQVDDKYLNFSIPSNAKLILK